MEDLTSKTVEVLYENYRASKLMNELGGSTTTSSKKGDTKSDSLFGFLVIVWLKQLSSCAIAPLPPLRRRRRPTRRR